MTSTLEPSATSVALPGTFDSLTDEEWLPTLQFRKSVSGELTSAAKESDAARFSKLLGPLLEQRLHLDKDVRKKKLKQLQLLFGATQKTVTDDDPLHSALFDLSLKKAERSVCVDALIAESGDEPENQSIAKALLVLGLHGKKLRWESRLALWRWSVQHGQQWMEEGPRCDPEQGLSQVRFLEVCFLLSLVLEELSGSSALQKETIRLIRHCLDESTDTDGTPQPPWIPDLSETLSVLARLTLVSDLSGSKLWNKEFRVRLNGLLERAASFAVSQHYTFRQSLAMINQDCLTASAQIISGADSGLARYFKSLSGSSSRQNKQMSDWTLPEHSHQSDWAKVACLRSGWGAPVDQAVVAFDSTVPQLDIVAASVPFASGGWSASLKVDGQEVHLDENWACTCWFSDEEVHFVELVQELGSSCRLVRQITQLRDENQMILTQAVHAPGARQLEQTSSMSLCGTWEYARDSVTREIALFQENQRVRIYPVSLPQDRVVGASGDFAVSDGVLISNQTSHQERACSAIVLDWSKKRINKSVDWSQLTIAEDGQIQQPDQAVGYRWRVGRQQWLLYHSLQEPDIPRTVMGLHTPHETVLAKLTSKGEIEPIVEVEI